jgi:hypothetical protein
MIDSKVCGMGNARLRNRGRIRGKLVRHNDVNIVRDVFSDVLGQRPGLYVLCFEEAEIAAALFNSDHDCFVVGGAPALLPVFPLRLSPHQGLVHLYYAVQWLRIDVLHCRPDAMAEIPCRFVASSQSPLDLIRAHSLARFAEQVDAQEPLPERKVGVIEDRSCRYGELITAGVAIKLVTLYDLRSLGRRATRASNVVRPAQSFKVGTATIFAAKLFDQRDQIYGVHCA